MHIDWTLTLGNILTFIGGIVSLVLAYSTLKSNVDRLVDRLDTSVMRLVERLETIERRTAEHEGRIRFLELAAGRSEEKLSAALAMLGRIERKIFGASE